MTKIAWLSVLFTLAMICGGCTASFQAHYPSKYNAVQTYEPGRTVYRGYTPPMPMDPPDGYSYQD